MPLHHSYGFDFGLLTALAHGTTLFLEDEVSPKRIAKLLREQKHRLLPGHARAVRRAGPGADRQAAQDRRAPAS